MRACSDSRAGEATQECWTGVAINCNLTILDLHEVRAELIKSRDAFASDTAHYAADCISLLVAIAAVVAAVLSK